MGKRILGLDLGTNSIGWAVVDDLGRGEFELVKRGVHIFPEGVKIEKGNESSKASERTGYRAARRIKFRRKLRKIETLKVLSDAGFCPPLSKEELKAWQSKKIYPENPAFREWCRTSDPKDKDGGTFDNPYYFRWLAATTVLNLDDETDRFKLGRAFYHMAQRRGFKSNRLDTTPEAADGVVKKDISELSEKMAGRTLGQYFWEECYRSGGKIRKVHTSRDEHYLAEFDLICKRQGLSDELRKALHRAIFFQRPLKSQKGLVANCPFEPKKKRVPVSHPLFEEFRLWQTLNHIKIKTEYDEDMRSLTADEKDQIMPLFFRVSKAHFDFKDIAKKLTPRGQKFGYVKGRDSDAHVLFNYRANQSLAGCPLTARLRSLFGDVYKQGLYESYCGGKKDQKSPDDVIHEVWHVLFSFDDVERVKEYAKGKLGLDEEGAEKFSKINPGQGYGALSLKAIRKILPFLKQGLLYSHAVFFANLEQVIGISAEGNATLKNDISKLVDDHNQYVSMAHCVNEFVREYKNCPLQFEEKYDLCDIQDFGDSLSASMQDFAESICGKVRFQTSENNGNGEYLPVKRLDERVADYLMKEFRVDSNAVKKLYHPSAIETYKPAEKHSDGKYYLGDPRISSIRNPVFMRAMHRVKAVVNELLKQGVITDQTQVHLEMARELNDANKRAAIKNWQRINEKKRQDYKNAIEEDLKGQGIERAPTDDEIFKYQLWEEQNHICPYTGKTIKTSDFIGENPRFDIEHTIPLSQSCDNSQENKTLCDRDYNRIVKKNSIPFNCPDYEQILQRIDHWQVRVDELNKLIEKQRPKSKYATTKEAKDSAIQKRLVWEFERNYLREKYRRFMMEEVTSGFKNSQLVDTRIITKYARLYLQTVFSAVHTVNGKTTDDFRRCWGVEKSRDNHAHHTVDAIVVACVTRGQYDKLAQYYHEYESYWIHDPSVPAKPHFPKPWQTFTEDMSDLKNEILVSHYAPNHLLKQTKKHAKVHGKMVVQQGKTARGSLHKDTFYGRIQSGGEERTVVRVPVVYSSTGGLFGFKNSEDFERIVDPAAREKIKESLRQRCGNGAKFVDALKDPIWMNEERRVAIKKVRCFVSSVKNPLPLKRQGFPSRHAHKKNYYVQNDSVYMVAIYESSSAICHVAYSALNAVVNGVDVPAMINQKGKVFSLKHILKGDQLVVFCENSVEELGGLPISDVCKRLFKVNDLESGRARATFRYHMDAREKGAIVEENALLRGKKYPSVVNLESPNPLQKVSFKNMTVAVDGVDFKLNVLGEIELVEDFSC